MTLQDSVDAIQIKQLEMNDRIAKLEMGGKPLKLTRFEFRSLFSFEELVAITTAAKIDVVIEVFMKSMEVAEEIDLTYSETANGLGYLVAQGFITQQKMDNILAGV